MEHLGCALASLLVTTLVTYGGTMKAPPNPGGIFPQAMIPEPWKSDICYPFACPKYTVQADFQTYQIRKYLAGKWLRVETKPFQLWNNHYQEIVDYISGENMTGAVPFLVQVDLPTGHEQLHQAYLDQMGALGQKMKQHIDNLNRMMPSNSANTRANFAKTRVQAIRNEFMGRAGAAEQNFLKDMKMTVYNYLHEKHSNAPAPKNLNLTIVNSPGFDVYATSFNSLVGRAVSYERAKNMSNLINTPMKTYYLVDYMQQLYRYQFLPFTFEIWLGLDPNKPVL